MGNVEKGIVWLPILMFLSTGGLVAMVGGIDPPVHSSAGRADTAHALALAKAALIGYAVSYAEQHPTGSHRIGPRQIRPHRWGPGPGYLPCPDIDDDGSPDTACGRDPIGRLPWRRLGLPDIRDAHGERLWYALANEFRNNPVKVTPLNVLTPGTLSLDGVNDYVAVIIAPGPPTPDQHRNDTPFDRTAYLEGANAAPRDGQFANQSMGNDRVVGITQRELMRGVERRAAREVERHLRVGVLPWLRPLADPNALATAPPENRVDATAGLLAVHRWAESFDTRFVIEWHQVPPSLAATAGPGNTSSDELRRVSVHNGQCRWFGSTGATCSGDALLDGVPVTVEVDVEGEWEAVAARRNDVRRRNVAWRGGHAILRIVPQAGTGAHLGGSMALQPEDLSLLRVRGIRYALDVPGELPMWFVENEWDDIFYVLGDRSVFAEGVGHDCLSSPPCLALASPSGVRRIHAALIAPGVPLGDSELENNAIERWPFDGLNSLVVSGVDVVNLETGLSRRHVNDRVFVLREGPAGVAVEREQR
ncbi:MAG: hypothetical protein AAF493_16315 [Pseudomonadota bacterium]